MFYDIIKKQRKILKANKKWKDSFEKIIKLELVNEKIKKNELSYEK